MSELKPFEFYYNNIKQKFNYEINIDDYNNSTKFISDYIRKHKTNEIKIDDFLNIQCYNCYDCFLCYYCEKCKECKFCENCKNCEKCDFCKNCINCDDCINCEDCNECFMLFICINCKNCECCKDCENCFEADWCRNCENCKSHIHDENNCKFCEIYWYSEQESCEPHSPMFRQENLKNVVLYKDVKDLDEQIISDYEKQRFK